MSPRTRIAALAVVGLAVAACGGSSPSTSTSGIRTPPDIAALLREPVATPSTCAAGPASADGRPSPWVGHVDISVFVKSGASPAVVAMLGRALRRASAVEKVYFESTAEAYAEFQRLYTCWASVPRSQTPASYRVVLEPTATVNQRNILVALMLRQPGVDTVSCDPSLPCTQIVASASAAPHH